MENPQSKKRSLQHVIGDDAVRILRSKVFPREWVVREIHPDYGIDLDVELFDDKSMTLGEHIFVQVKGTENIKFGTVSINNSIISAVKFSIEVSEINLIERMGSAIPVLLMVVDITSEKVYQICLNDYIKKVLPIKNPNYRNQRSITIYIPKQNEIYKDKLDVLKWYGKRTKIYSIFHEMLVDIADMKYMDRKEKIKFGKQIVAHYITYDLLNSEDVWPILGSLREMISTMNDNDCILPRAISFVKHSLEPGEDWEHSTVYTSDYEEVNSYLFTQEFSLNMLADLIEHCSSCFETYCREWFMPGLLLGVLDEKV